MKEVQQAMSEYKERKKRETEARYQRRLFIFAENQENMANERAEQWEEKARRIQEAQKTVSSKETKFRETIKEKLAQKFEKFKENHSRYHTRWRNSVRINSERLDAARTSNKKQTEERTAAAAEKIKRKFEASQENREAAINEKVAKIQKKQAKIQQTKMVLERSLEVSSTKKMTELEVKLDQSAVKRQLREREIREKAKADYEKAKELKRLREEKERRFSDCTKENLQVKFEKAEEVREKNAALRQQAYKEKAERELKAKSVADQSESEHLRIKIEQKLQRSKENRAAILNAKVLQCQKESTKVKNTKENAEEQIRNQEKATDKKLQAKLNSYKENRQRRLSERKVKRKESHNKTNRQSLLEITNDGSAVVLQQQNSPQEESTSEKIPKKTSSACSNEVVEDVNDGGKLKELAENFRNRNLEYLGMR